MEITLHEAREIILETRSTFLINFTDLALEYGVATEQRTLNDNDYEDDGVSKHPISHAQEYHISVICTTYLEESGKG